MASLPLWVPAVPPDAPLLGFLPLSRLEERLLYDARLQRLWNLLRERHGESQFRLPQAARFVGSNKDHLNCLIKGACGLTFVDILNLYRVSRAAEQLWTRNCSITEVYLDCGFNSATTFGRQFRSWTGRRPSDFRRESRRARCTVGRHL